MSRTDTGSGQDKVRQHKAKHGKAKQHRAAQGKGARDFVQTRAGAPRADGDTLTQRQGRRPVRRTDVVRESERGGEKDQPRDLNAERAKLAEKLMRLVAEVKQVWRSCERPPCRRAQTCRGGPVFPCIDAQPRPPVSPEEDARIRADLLRALQARMRELAAERDRE